MVISIARKYTRTGAIDDDVIGAGQLGLVEAARRFEPARGLAFITYATHWVKACILEHMLRTRGPVRIGTRRADRAVIYNIGRARRATGGSEDPEQLAAAINDGELKGKVTAQDVADLVPRLMSHDVSLDAPVADGARQYHEKTPDPGESPEELVAEHEEATEKQRLLKNGLRQLDRRERIIVRARYLRQTPKTLKEVAIKLGISRERVRQLETRALAKLKEMV